jgi:hypothetical protein
MSVRVLGRVVRRGRFVCGTLAGVTSSSPNDLPQMIANAEKRATFSFLINGRKQMITSYLAINGDFIFLLGKSAKYGTSEDICGHLRFYLRPVSGGQLPNLPFHILF